MVVRRHYLFVLVTCSLIAALPSSAQDKKAAEAAEAAPSGSVSGSVSLEGGDKSMVVVHLEKVPGSAAPSPVKAAKITQRGTAFTPNAIVVTKGSRVDFPNEDKFYHNVFSVTEGNEFDLGMYRSGESKSAVLEESGEVSVYCNIHPGMEARVLVVDNDFYAEVKDGAYSVDGVPPGSYTLVAWSPAHKAEKKKITIEAGKKARADFTLKPDENKAHLNKHGEQYGRYK